MRFSKRTYRVARDRIISKLIVTDDSEFNNIYNLGVRIVNRARREKGMWRNG